MKVSPCNFLTNSLLAIKKSGKVRFFPGVFKINKLIKQTRSKEYYTSLYVDSCELIKVSLTIMITYLSA
jgi:hypothetical protein